MIKRNWTKTLSITAIVLSFSAIAFQIFVMATEKKELDDKQYKQLIKNNYQIFSAPMPEKVTFCGQEVPIDNVFVREALDRELMLTMFQQYSSVWIMKKAGRFFPDFERILKENGLPDDLKYLAVAESALIPQSSPSKAEGIWQFIAPSAKLYGLEVNADYDERYDVEKATYAACQYLKKAYGKWKDWPLACATYNCSEAAIISNMKQQGCDNYWDLYINQETARYVYRIIAYKIIMENPQQYGFCLRKTDLYPVLPYKEVIIDSNVTDLHNVSKALNISYKALRSFNPQLRSRKLPNKTGKKYKLRIPTDNNLSWKSLMKDVKNEPLFSESENAH